MIITHSDIWSRDNEEPRNENIHQGDYLFEGIEILRTSPYSHYLITYIDVLEINAMKAIFNEFCVIDNKFDILLSKEKWGILYPFYSLFKNIQSKLV